MLNLSRCSLFIKNKITICLFKGTITCSSFLISTVANAQVIPDGTVNTQVNQTGNVSEIIGGETRGSNLFHSFQEFSVDIGNEAFFNNIDTIENIFSRVTGGNVSNIDGLIRANSANLFLLNPAGIIFGESASLNIGGSFYGSTADSIIFPDGIEFSATDTQAQPILTINAPIGLNFRDDPQPITNSSIFDIDNLVGLRVPANETLALIGGNIFINGGFLTTIGGRIELGSVAENSRVSLTPIEQGFDVSYEEVANFQDISLSSAALVNNEGVNPGDIEVQGRNISLIEGSQIGIAAAIEGQAGNLTVIASESLSLDGNGIEVGMDNFATNLFNNISGGATGEGSKITLNTPQLTLTNGAQINALVIDQGQEYQGQKLGADIVVSASDIVVGTPFINGEVLENAAIFAQVRENGFSDGGNITIETDNLILNEGGQITTDTFGGGNAGNLTVNASESIELTGTIADRNDPKPSGLFANVGNRITATGNAGNLTINTPQLVVRDGAQIGTVAQNQGNAGTLTINATESVLLTGTSPFAVLEGPGRNGIFVSAQPALEAESGEIIPTTGNGGTVNLNTKDLTIEQGAFISINTFSEGNGGSGNISVNKLIVRDGGQIGAGSRIGVNSLDPEGVRGNGGTLKINATESVEITGIGSINGKPVNSSIFTEAQSSGKAGDLIINTNNLKIFNGGDVNTSATGTGAAGDLTITSNSLDLDGGKLTASTAAVRGGNIRLDVEDNITLRNESLISAEATKGKANGGNVTVFDSKFIIGYPSQPNGNDILASAIGGTGGEIEITAKSLYNIQKREALPNNETNDIDASSEFGLDGDVSINNQDLNTFQEISEELKIVVSQPLGVDACSRSEQTEKSTFTVKGKGGIPRQPIEPFMADLLIPDGKPITLDKESDVNSLLVEEHETEQVDPYYIPPDIKPIETSMGDIYPARGVIKTDDGRIILTTYPTDNANTRTLHKSANCTP